MLLLKAGTGQCSMVSRLTRWTNSCKRSS